MPIYEYLCNNCGHKFEELRSMDDKDKEISCPKCKSQNTNKVISCFGVGNSRGNSNSSAPCGGG